MKHCLVCGGDEIDLLTSINNAPAEAQCFLKSYDSSVNDSINLQIYFCSNCGHVQSGGNLVSYYKDVITASGSSKLVMQNRLNNIVSAISTHSDFDQIHLLDIGSGDFSFLDHIKPLNIFSSVTGLENSLPQNYEDSHHSAYYIKGYIDNSITLAQLPLLPSHYQFLTCFNFLEHIPDPYSFLQKLKIYLADSALLYFTVPSLDFILRTNCVHEFIADHISYFSVRSLSLLFQRCGYNVIKCNSINNDNDLEILALYQPPAPLNLNTGFTAFRNQLNSLITSLKSSNNTISFWGAGHRNLTLISQLDFHLIDFIVDSADFKQGLFSPVSKIPIISPTEFQKCPTTSLFISLPGVYNQEVLNTVVSWSTTPTNIYFISENTIELVSK